MSEHHGIARDGHTLRERNLPSGGLAVSHHWVHGVRDAVTVGAEDRPLYRLLWDVLAETRTPPMMPARLATECDNLVDAREAVADVERGHAGIGGASYGLSYLHNARDAIDAHRDRPPLRLIGVGCSGSKHHDDEPMPARERYKRAYWTCKRRYGETVGDEWRIISAEHAVLDPDTLIDYYERTPDDLRGIPIDSDQRLPSGEGVTTLLNLWALDVYEGLSAWLADAASGVDPRDVELEILLGRDYRDPLEERGVFDALAIPGELSVSHPYQEVKQAQGGNGNQMGWMTDEVARVGGESVAE